jgi:hypothetical protein
MIQNKEPPATILPQEEALGISYSSHTIPSEDTATVLVVALNAQ